MARKPDPDARDRILTAASHLFTERGVHAVGLQEIIDGCGHGKNLLYREFGSKDDLVVAYLEQSREESEATIDQVIGPMSGDAASQLVAIVAAVAGRATEPGFRGCPLRNAYSEFPDPAHPAHRIVKAHYAARRSKLRELARRANADDPETLADRIELIIDGVHANGAVLGGDGATPAAVTLARELVAAATTPGARRRSGRRSARPVQ
jgi:AcrR family transcriptional regulator